MSAECYGIIDSAPLIAILRGVRPEEIGALAEVLHEHGFRVLEVPLNSPRPMESVRAAAAAFTGRLIVGAGTVLEADQVDALAQAGGRLVVAPNTSAEVVTRALDLGLEPVPGVATPSEAFAAIALGARVLKVFPCEALSPAAVRAWRAVLPPGVKLIAVGGITPELMAGYRAAGVTGFGLGSALYRPGRSPAEVAERARAFREAAAALPACGSG